MAIGSKHWNRLGFERELWQQGMTLVAGVDEAGCGPLAGPVVAAAVLFPCSWLATGLYSKLRGLNDSKQLNEEARNRFFQVIITHPEIRFGIASVGPEMSDQINILEAAHGAMHLALDQLPPAAPHVLVGGRPVKTLLMAFAPLVKGDCR